MNLRLRNAANSVMRFLENEFGVVKTSDEIESRLQDCSFFSSTATVSDYEDYYIENFLENDISVFNGCVQEYTPAFFDSLSEEQVDSDTFPQRLSSVKTAPVFIEPAAADQFFELKAANDPWFYKMKS